MKYKLAELIDAEKTQELLRRFRDAVGISAAIIDLEGKVLVTTPWQRICADFHRESPATCKRCIESDTMLANELLTQGRSFSLYKCLNGLTDAASPIIIEGEHMANAFIGQFLTEKPDLDLFSLQADRCGFNKSDYFKALSEVPVLEQDVLPALLAFLTSFAEMTASLGLRQLRQMETEKELKEARQKLEAQNEEFRASQEDLNRAQAVASIGSWRLDVGRNVLNWSDEAYRIFGISKGIPVTYETFLAKVHPDDREMADRSWQAALSGSPYNIEHRILVDDRIKWVHGQAEMEFDEHGVLRGGLGTVQDITERKLAQTELQRAKQQWEHTFDSVPDLIAILDTQHRITRVNREMAKRLGLAAGNCAGLRCYEHVHGSSSPPDFCPHSRTLKDGREHIAEVHEECLGGHFIVSTTPLFDEHGIMTGTVHVARDITELKGIEQELRRSRDELEIRVRERTEALQRSNQDLQDFAFIASHDLREPLRKVISFGSMLKNSCGDSLGQTGNDYLNRMLDATRRMTSLLMGLLEYSRVTTKSDPFAKANLTVIVSEVLSDLEVKIETTGAQVQLEELPVVKADPTQMRQLFQNLIGNALKFHKTGEKPAVKISSSSIDDCKLQIVVEDKGIGFDEKYLDKIFAPFQRLHGKSSQFKGSGVGLAICKKIVERHGGSITATSTPGVGSSFIIRLPLDTDLTQ